MRHRSVRIGLAVAAILASIAAGWYAVQTARETARLEAAARTFDHDAQDVIVETAALKAGQRAYVAPGQGEDFWTQYVARTLESIRGGLATLERTAASPDAVASLKPAETFADQLADMDARVRKGLQIGDMLAASDTIFSEGEQAAANLARQVDVARNQELARSDQLVTSDRRRQALAVGGAALAGLVVLSLLAFGDVVRRAGDRSEEPRLMLA
ncbi:MAG TPA: hypothetical protein VND92_03485, partial [Vicinamibacterales bacterium]|nr:hypothetical protein [Vicinamibacterales bacterium]